MSEDVDGVDGRDEAIDQAVDLLGEDDLNGFAIAAVVDGELTSVSFTPLDNDPEPFADARPCQLPRNELLGKLLADFAVIYGEHPEHVAEVGTHVAVDHLGVDEDRIETLRTELEMEDTHS